jgi:acetate kinase
MDRRQMGLTPLEGLPGGTRSGSVDPTLIFHLFPDASKQVQNGDITLSKGELLLNKESGVRFLWLGWQLLTSETVQGADGDK